MGLPVEEKQRAKMNCKRAGLYHREGSRRKDGERRVASLMMAFSVRLIADQLDRVG